ncbi:uncharacterized protein NPIL_382361 [Nephila pilipes]|uniref:Uncharacterized protein n=1 Tax=Nephila pilipes TaxID=299642 RepID=A0A8X6QFB0_NEPPI|nr:uncharacterized protein NPIL_382361 [Nephila pilipes]
MTVLGVERIKSGDFIGCVWLNEFFLWSVILVLLIGTSGHLLQSAWGNEIDKDHSCVFRFGFSPTKGYEEYVGSRTTARIVDSFRFFPFLKKPQKLITGPFTSDLWFLFDRSPGDITRFHGPFLKSLLQKHDTQFFWFNLEVEKEIFNSLSNKRLNSIGKRVSALWFTTRVIEDAGCKTLTIYGVPDAQICKRNLNISIPSLYWNQSSPDLCENGVDASMISTNSKASVSQVPTIAERKSLPAWAKQHLYKFDQKSPTWSQSII